MNFIDTLILYDAIVLAALALDFALVRRHSTSVVARGPAVLLAVAWLASTIRVNGHRVEFAATGAVVLLSALFGYANFLAFVKRGVTFSILHNHSLPPDQRRPDSDFIAIDERLGEMQGHGWVRSDSAGWTLTGAGQRVVRLRRTLLRVLRIEAVG